MAAFRHCSSWEQASIRSSQVARTYTSTHQFSALRTHRRASAFRRLKSSQRSANLWTGRLRRIRAECSSAWPSRWRSTWTRTFSSSMKLSRSATFSFNSVVCAVFSSSKKQGVTILFVSHDLEAVRNLADRVIWMEHGSVRLEGKTDDVVSKYLAAMVTRGRKEIMEEEALGKPLFTSTDLDLTDEALARIPKFIEHIPNVDHRYGNGKARIAGIGIYGREGETAASVAQGDRICVRISVEFQDAVEHPNVGFMLRNRLGEDVTGTNVMFEGERLPAARAGERLSVDFVLDLPFLHAGFYHFSPAVADGTLDQYEMCDWVENACVIEVIQRSTTYGHLRIPMRVRAMAVSSEISKVL
jgi:Wzt C-terminal domain